MGFYSRYVFPRILDWSMSNDRVREQRDKALAGVGGEVLEVGFGSGLNLPHYPAAVKKLTTVDVNPGMSKLARKRIERSPIEIEHHLMSGEDLPMEDGSFDSVVSTWTLCSIPHVEQALSEIRRVLRPGGRFFFIEHGLSPDEGVARWQRRLNPIQKVIGDGCNLDRDMGSLIEGAGLEMERLATYYFEKSPRILGYFYRGVARKPEG